MKEIFVDRNKRIAIYDDLFTLFDRGNFYDFAEKSLFQIGWADGHIAENQKYRFLHSRYSQEDIDRMGIVEKIMQTPAAEEIKGHTLEKAILNLSTPSDVNFFHAHPENKVLLYYVNLVWSDGWHGETLFFDEPCKEIVLANPYTPGRLVVFDATIPHAIRPQSYIAPFYRYTLALIYNKNK
jgi:hypothetical protein